MIKKRLLPSNRKEQILAAAITIAEQPGGWARMTRESVAREAQCADGLVSKYFGTMVTFRRSVMRHAIETENLAIIAQGLADNDMYAKKASPELKGKALKILEH